MNHLAVSRYIRSNNTFCCQASFTYIEAFIINVAAKAIIA